MVTEININFQAKYFWVDELGVPVGEDYWLCIALEWRQDQPGEVHIFRGA